MSKKLLSIEAAYVFSSNREDHRKRFTGRKSKVFFQDGD